MSTEFNDSQHYGFFMTGTKLTSETGKYLRQSELTLAGLRAAGFLDNMIDGTSPPSDLSQLWLDKNSDPAVLKEWNPIGAAWEQVTSQTLFGRVPWRGEWEASAIYRRADVVGYQGRIWIAIQTSQNHPPAEGTYWDLFLESAADDSIATAALQNGAVTTVKIADGAVNREKLATGLLAFADRLSAAGATIDFSVHAIELRGDAAEGDGLGGLYVDTDNGSPDTFTSSGATSRTWYLAEDITAKRIKRSDQFSILEKLEVDRDPRALPQNPVYTPTTSLASRRVLFNGNTENGGSPVYHRHFGSIAVDHRGVIHLVYRRALGHAGYFPGVICYATLDHNGNERSAETVLVEPALPDGRDLHSPMLLVLPTGRIIMTYTELNTSTSGGACLFKCMHSDDNGVTWSSPVTFANMLAARTFGQPRVVPSNVAGERWKIIQPWYGPGTVGARRIGLYESHDDGASWEDRSVPIYEGANMDLNETSVAILNARVWFAACRHNAGLINWFVTTDAGATWTAPVEATWGSTPGWDVAPSLDVACVDGIDYLLIGYCDRATDQTKWRWAKASKLLANPEAFGDLVAITSSTDMIASSGYQIPVFYPNGQMLFVEFREYTPPGGDYTNPTGSDVLIDWATPAEWISGRAFTWTPVLIGATTPGTPTYSSVSGYVEKEASGKTTINARITLTAKGGMGGALRINNLPVKVKNASAAQPIGKVLISAGVTGGSTYTEVIAVGLLNSKNLDLYKFVPGTGHTPLLATDITDAASVYISMVYFTDE